MDHQNPSVLLMQNANVDTTILGIVNRLPQCWVPLNAPPPFCVRPQGQPQALMTCSQLHKKAERIGAVLIDKAHLNTGDHVALIYPPGLELIAAFFGCLYVGKNRDFPTSTHWKRDPCCKKSLHSLSIGNLHVTYQWQWLDRHCLDY